MGFYCEHETRTGKRHKNGSCEDHPAKCKICCPVCTDYATNGPRGRGKRGKTKKPKQKRVQTQRSAKRAAEELTTEQINAENSSLSLSQIVRGTLADEHVELSDENATPKDLFRALGGQRAKFGTSNLPSQKARYDKDAEIRPTSWSTMKQTVK